MKENEITAIHSRCLSAIPEDMKELIRTLDQQEALAKVVDNTEA